VTRIASAASRQSSGSLSVTELTRIVGELAQATSFSISVGTALSVTVNFGPSTSQ
jgi:hypothetical protein